MIPEETAVQSIMTTSAPIIRADTTILAAARTLAGSQSRFLLVTDESGELLGVVSDRDLLKHVDGYLAETGQSPETREQLQQAEVSEIMTCPSFSVTPGAPANVAAAAFMFEDCVCVPVVTESGRLIGAVTRERVATLYVEQELRKKLRKEMVTFGKNRQTRASLKQSLKEGKAIDFDGYALTPRLYEDLCHVDLLGPEATLPAGGLVVDVTAHAEPGELMRRVGSDRELMDTILSRTPQGRIGTPEECGRLAVFLASDDSNFIFGQSIYIDGGRGFQAFPTPGYHTVTDEDYQKLLEAMGSE